MWLDALAGGLLVLFTAIGALRGALASGLALATLVLSYAAAALGGPWLAPALAARVGLGGLECLVLASFGAFVATFLAMGVLGWALRRHVPPPEGAGDRFLGGAFGALRGAGLVLLLAWLALWLEAARSHGVAPFLPELGPSTTASVTHEVVERVVEAGLGEEAPGSRVVAKLAARPSTALRELGEVAESPRFAALREDAMFWGYVESGNVDAALARRSYLDLQRDDALRGHLAALGLVPEEAADDAAAFRASVDEVLRQVGPRLRAVKRDPALQALLEDPEVMAMLEAGDTLGLLRHRELRALVDRAISRPESEDPP